jgi:MFS family permease
MTRVSIVQDEFPDVVSIANRGSCDPKDAIRPRGHNLRWAVVLMLTFVGITNYLDRSNLSVAAPLIMKDMGINNASMGLLLSAFVWSYGLASLPVGWAIDRFGAKACLAWAAGLWSFISMATGLARSSLEFVGLRILLGVTESPVYPAALKITNDWFPEREKAQATGVFLLATKLGLALAPPITTFLMLTVGWRWMFAAMGSFGLVGLWGLLIIHREPEKHPRLDPAEFQYIRAGQQTSTVLLEPLAAREWIGLFRYPTTWALVAGAFCSQYVFWFYVTWLPTYLQNGQGLSFKEAGIIASLPYLAGAIAVLVGGKISDSLIAKGVSPLAARKNCVSVACLLTAAAMFVTAHSSSVTWAVVSLTIGMFTFSLQSASFWILAADVLETRKFVGSIASIQNSGGFIGGALAPIVTGVVIDLSKSFTLALLIAGCLLIVAAAIYGLVLQKRIPL